MNKKILIAIIAFAVVIALVAAAYFIFVPKATGGSKEVTVIFSDNKGETKTTVIKTDALYLADAMTEAGLEYEVADTYVTAINGITADYNKDMSYWAFYVNGEYCNYGIFEQPVNDGDSFKIEYTIYEG
ncbi:MAG: DUF4430 domain-containing protein [Clostridia bacterium]|nr:DUF4430 domain-containing protein [Clostridia bacterium]